MTRGNAIGLGILGTIFVLLVAMGSYHAGPKVIPNTVHVTETDYHIVASRTVFHPGVTYHFIVTNASSDPHELMIGPKMAAGMPMVQMDAHSLAMIETIAPGQTATLAVRFPASMPAAMPGMAGKPMMQQWEFSCHL